MIAENQPKPQNDPALAGLVNAFHRDGFVRLQSAISRERALQFAELVERRYIGVRDAEADADLIRGGVSLMRMFECDTTFRDLLIDESIISLVESILGLDCHVISQNALRTPPGKAIINWHIDDALFFPFLESLDHSERVPCYSVNVMIALSDIEDMDCGPTEVVVGSHLSGRIPEYSPELPSEFPVTPILASSGDAYLVNTQTWHRGSQNLSGRVRYLLSTTYGCRFISQRFYPFLNYVTPAQVTADAPDRLLRILGKHEKGPQG